ncbi:MAG: altronate dehydratase family protein, partial [Clostridia bacterium]
MEKAIKIKQNDNCAVALQNLQKGENYFSVTLTENIDKGHKFALSDINVGDKVIKYGEKIGCATQNIHSGSHIHTHNLSTNISERAQYEYVKTVAPRKLLRKEKQVNVYERANGDIGVRNELWVVTTVGCVNSQAKSIVEEFKRRNNSLDGIDGVFAITHPYGCSQVGQDYLRTRKFLQEIVLHPNAGGVLVLGLGCENNQMSDFIATLGNFDESRIKFLIAQEVDDEIDSGARLLQQIYEVARQDRRSPHNISCLKVGLKCGGSDGLSGITANPLVGLFCDYLTEAGGTAVLTEVPEMFGAERLLMSRAKDISVFNKTVKLINDFKDYYISNNQQVYDNPSPGNKQGGITTLEDKSLGCTQKSGFGQIDDVVFDGETLTNSGLNLLNGVGNDMVAVTNLGASGCQMVIFTTGRGTPFGGFVPTLKVSTNNDLYNRKRNWIDFNAGEIIDGEKFSALVEKLIDLVVDVANGKQTAN